MSATTPTSPNATLEKMAAAAASQTKSEERRVSEKYSLPGLFDNLFVLFYRHGMNATLTKAFFFKPPEDAKTLQDVLLAARVRAQKHCKVMGYHYIFVRPLIIDLDAEENYKLSGAREGEILP
jgi:hypothetical protein